MTEPTSEAIELAYRLPTLSDGNAAREIDALTEQRVAAAVERFATAILHGNQEHRDWLRGAASAFIAGDPIEVPADRPAPEGAAPITDHVFFDGGSFGGGDQGKCIICGKDAYLHAPADLARPRCSTPSQEDTGSVSGERWRKKPVVIEAIQWTGDNREEVFAWLRPQEDGKVYYIGDVAGTGSCLAVETLEGKTSPIPVIGSFAA